MIFKNRVEAGYRLAASLQQYRNCKDGLILALPRGGVAIGYAMSVDLHLPLDVFITRKIGVPDNPEYALGAVSETGNIHVNLEAASLYGLSYQQVEEFARVEREEIRRRQHLYRKGRPAQPLKDRIILLVDDGIATGATFFASVEAIRRQHPRLLVGAIPVGPPDIIVRARGAVDDLVVLATPDGFLSVGSQYAEFGQVSDNEVVNYLHAADLGMSGGMTDQKSRQHRLVQK